MNRFLPSLALIGLALLGGCGIAPKEAVGPQPLTCQGTERASAVLLAYYFENQGLLLSKVAKRTLVAVEADGIKGVTDTVDLAQKNQGAVYDNTQQLHDSYVPCNAGLMKFTAYVEMTNGVKASGTVSVDYSDSIEEHATATELKMTMTAQ